MPLARAAAAQTTHRRSADMEAKFKPGDRVYHRGRHEHVVYLGLDEADPSGATSWVRLSDGDELMVSTHLLAPA